MKTTEQFVNFGFSTNEPSIEYIVYTYYSKFFPEKEAKELTTKYCEELEKKL